MIEHFISRIPENVVVEFSTGKDNVYINGMNGESLNGKRFIKWGIRKYDKKSKATIDWIGFVWSGTWEEAFEKLVHFIERKGL